MKNTYLLQAGFIGEGPIHPVLVGDRDDLISYVRKKHGEKVWAVRDFFDNKSSTTITLNDTVNTGNEVFANCYFIDQILMLDPGEDAWVPSREIRVMDPKTGKT